MLSFVGAVSVSARVWRGDTSIHHDRIEWRHTVIFVLLARVFWNCRARFGHPQLLVVHDVMKVLLKTVSVFETTNRVDS